MLFMSASDAAIVRRTLEGQPEAFEPLVFRYQRKAHALARAAGLGTEAADDVVQEAFLQAFRDLPSLRDPARFGAWFLSIARNVSRKALERQPPVSRSLPVEPPSAAGAEPVEKKDFSDYLRQKVSELPQGIREAIFLYYYEGRKVREVARALSLTGWGVKRRLRTGRGLLRSQLWRELEECLRDMLPSVREWRRKGGRLALLVLASLPLSFASRSGAALPPAGRRARWMERAGTGGLAGARTTAMSLAALGLLLIVLGGASGISLHFAKQSGEEARAVAKVISKRPRAADPAPAREGFRQDQPATEPETSREPAAPVPAPDPDDLEYERSLGSILVRVVWEEDRAPAAGIHGMVIPWGSPALYIDEREFITGPDGTVLVERVYQGGVSVMLDRGGRTDVNLTPGEGNEATVEVPRGLNVEGVVVDWSGFAVGGARVWISYGGHTNWGNEVATSAADGSFCIRSVPSESFIAARAADHAPSAIRQLKGKAGDTVQARIVLPGRGGGVLGSVHDAQGDPISHAKVMVGSEFPSFKMLEDGANGLSAPPHLVFTDEEGRFHTDSLAPGETRVAVRARGFAPLEGTVAVEPGSLAEMDLVLSRGATLYGTVTGAGRGPATGVRIVTGDWNQNLALKVFSSSGGYYKLRGLPPGEVEVFAEREGWGKASTRLTVKDRETLRWDPVLSSDLEILGRVVDESGVGIEDFRVVVEEMLGAGRRFRSERKEKTGNGGSFRIAGASDVAYRLLIYEPLGAFPCAVLEEVRPAPGEFLVRIDRDSLSSSYFLGRVLDPTGAPVGGAKLLSSGQISGFGVYVTGKEEGRFQAGPLPPGRYRLEVQVQGYPPLEIGEKEVSSRAVVDLGDLWLRLPGR